MNALYSTINTTESIYFANDDLNHDWIQSQMQEVIKLWNNGWSAWDIAKVISRHVDEVALLLIDFLRKGIINERPGGVYGRSVRK